MKIIIAGDGKVGLAMTQQLVREGHDVTVVDTDPTVLQRSQDLYDVMTVQGNAAAINTLREAGAADADLLIASMSADELNLLCCLTAKSLNSGIHTIARVRNPEYTEQLFEMREMLGLSLTLNPELTAAREIYQLLQFPAFLRRDSFGKGRVEIVELRVDASSKLNGIALSNLYSIARVKVLVCAVMRGRQVFIPSGNFTLQEGDHIYVTARAVNLAQLIKNLKIGSQKVRQALLIGGGRVSQYLAERLLSSGVKVKIIEHDPARAAYLAELLPAASIILGDGAAKDVLDSEGIAESDALVTLTGIDEENIVTSMYGNAAGVSKIITKVDRLEYGSLFTEMGVGSVISPKELCSAIVVRYVRAMQNQTGSVVALHRIADGNAEAMEFRVDKNVYWRGRPLKSVPLRSGVLIACITRRGETIIPDGSCHFEEGDTVVVVTTCESPFRQMNDIFRE